MTLISQSVEIFKQYSENLLNREIHLIDGMINEYTANAVLEMRRNVVLPHQRKNHLVHTR